MSKSHFIDRYNGISKQGISAAVIIDSKSSICGKIIVRHVDSYIGTNREAGIIFESLDYSKTYKTAHYADVSPIIQAFNGIGCRVFDRINGEQLKPNGEVSNYECIRIIKKGNKIFHVYWAL